jgi:pyridoxamine 5'-phosphate oxidase
MVIVREVDEAGLVFYTDRDSPKARDLLENPRAALVFFWPVGRRQARVVGSVERTSRQETEANFRTRPREAQLVTWIQQSRVVGSRDEIEAELRNLAERFAQGEIPLPPHWSGFRLRPERFEFWEERPDRLHERLLYRQDGGAWVVERLTP